MSLIWCNAGFAGEAFDLLVRETASHQLCFSKFQAASNLVSAGADEALLDAEIAFGQPEPADLLRAPRIRWVHLTSAGYTRYDTVAFREAAQLKGIALTNSSAVYADPCAEHAFAFMLAQARQLPFSFRAQTEERSWKSAQQRNASRLLGGNSVLFLGFGAIARRLSDLLAPFNMRTLVFRRKPLTDAAFSPVSRAELHSALGEADHVVNILPENDETRLFVDSAFFASMKPGAVFYNIGRGTTVDQEALLAALLSGRLAAAWLDVTAPEPLPPEHPLWSAPNCYITPHTAGGHSTEFVRLVQHFAANLARFDRGEPLLDRVI